mmetsp:Transcript_7159/g.16793  ORF Transcript_7159/g.16793 Transcript_7159/m.16793 type:complete len:281 (-) Transcript_7159:14-856(-)
MRIALLVLLCAVALGGGRRHGRRLFQNIERKPRPAAAVASPRKEPAPEAEPAPLTANRTIGLLRERELLQDRVAAIDRALAADRDQKRRDLTAQYEREMRELEDDWGAGAAPARASPSPELNGALRQQVSAALASYRQPPRGSELPHQDVEHQDIDIDVMMMHIDKDGDGVITPAEAYGRQAGAQGLQGLQGLQAGPQLVGGNAWKLLAPAIIGCACAIACYLSMRQLVALRLRPSRGSGPHDHCGLPSDASRKRRKNALTSSSIPPTCYNRPADRDPVR